MSGETSYSIAEISRALGLTFWGDGAIRIARAAAPHEAAPDALALAASPDYAGRLAEGRARAALLWEGADPEAFGLDAALFAPRPRYALAGLSALVDPGPAIAPGHHPTAHIDPSAEIGAGAAIGPFAVIGPGAVIGPDARIAAHVTIGAGARIGARAMLLEHAHFGARCRAGDELILQPGAVVGSDGYSFVTPEKSATEAVRETLGDTQGTARDQQYARIHSLAAVTIGDNVEIGANSCVDRGTLSDTRIGSGTKIDNMVQVSHNVVIGRDCLLCGHSGVAGSTVVGDRLVLGGQSGIADHLRIGDDVIVAATTSIRTNQPSGRVLLGDPAMQMDKGIEVFKAIRRLPRLMRDVAEIRKHLSNGGGSG